ncbi:MAG: ROK family protein [Chthoniobacterales bacterium]|nr:ROK family protein [Chthoniobacterales bacterium]
MRKIDLTSFQVATSETARDINRRIVLDMIRTRQPVSRADLSRLSGLQRSTISVITEQLIEEQWITEGAFGYLPRGRKPRFLHLNVERAGIIGINVRPTSTTIALADLNARFIAQESFPTAAEPQAFLRDLCERVADFIKLRPQVFYEGIGVSLPGRVDHLSQRLVFAPNLGWRDVDLKKPLESATGLLVEIENAANACALAEIWFGQRTDGMRDLIAVTVSEGIGTGIIANGQLVIGSTGMAGEFGHVSINEDGPPCKCGNRGCWEVYASNSATIRAYMQATSSSRANKANIAQRSNEPTFDDILRLAKRGDVRAAEVLDHMAYYLGVGMSMLITGIAPSLIVLVGEVTRAWERVNPIVKKVIAERAPTAKLTRIVPAEDAAQPRLRGTIALVLQKHFGAPSTA